MIDTNDSEGDTVVCQVGNLFFLKIAWIPVYALDYNSGGDIVTI